MFLHYSKSRQCLLVVTLTLKVWISSNRTNKNQHEFEVFYRVMHFSAKRGLAITCRLSVCLSVALVDCDHIGWNSSEIISPLVSLGCSLTADPNIRGLLQGEHQEILAQSDPPQLIWASETFNRKLRLNGYSAIVTMESLLETTIALPNVAIAEPLRPPLPLKWGFHMPQDMQMAISP